MKLSCFQTNTAWRCMYDLKVTMYGFCLADLRHKSASSEVSFI